MEQTISCLFTVERRMVMEIREVGDGNAKKEICDTVLHRLPEWFGIEESIAEYVSLVEEMPFYGVYDGERLVGFLAVKVHNAFTAEVCVMGILKEYHRMGIGAYGTCGRVLSTEGIGLSYGKNTGWFCGF